VKNVCNKHLYFNSLVWRDYFLSLYYIFSYTFRFKFVQLLPKDCHVFPRVKWHFCGSNKHFKETTANLCWRYCVSILIECLIFSFFLIDCLIDWLIDWLTDWLTDWLPGWLSASTYMIILFSFHPVLLIFVNFNKMFFSSLLFACYTLLWLSKHFASIFS